MHFLFINYNPNNFKFRLAQVSHVAEVFSEDLPPKHCRATARLPLQVTTNIIVIVATLLFTSLQALCKSLYIEALTIQMSHSLQILACYSYYYANLIHYKLYHAILNHGKHNFACYYKP